MFIFRFLFMISTLVLPYVLLFLLGRLLSQPIALRSWLGLGVGDTSDGLGKVATTISLIGYLLMIYAPLQLVVLILPQLNRFF